MTPRGGGIFAAPMVAEGAVSNLVCVMSSKYITKMGPSSLGLVSVSTLYLLIKYTKIYSPSLEPFNDLPQLVPVPFFHAFVIETWSVDEPH